MNKFEAMTFNALQADKDLNILISNLFDINSNRRVRPVDKDIIKGKVKQIEDYLKKVAILIDSYENEEFHEVSL